MNGKRNILTLLRPSSWHSEPWREATPVGSGRCGALLAGGTGIARAVFTHHQNWYHGFDQELPDVSESLPEMRHLMDEGRFLEASRIMHDALKSKGYAPRMQKLCPVCELKLNFLWQENFRHYRRTLDLETGTAGVTFESGENKMVRRAFYSRVNDVFAWQITAKKGAFRCRMELKMPETREPYVSAYSDMMKELAPTLKTECSQDFITLKAQHAEDLLWFGAVCRAIPAAGSTVQVTDGKLEAAGQSLLLLVKTFAKVPDPEAAIAALKKELAAETRTFEALQSAHTALHGELFNRASVELAETSRANEELLNEAYEEKASPELLEKLWRFGRYLFISGTAIDGSPFPLYGLFCGSYEPGWAQHVANENVEMIYWHTMTGNLPELVKPLIDYYFEKMPVLRTNAKRLYGCRGIFVGTYTTPNNSSAAPALPVTLHFLGCAGWLCRHFLDYWRMTGDEEYLQEKILPFLLETAAFYEDYVTFDAKDQANLYPCVSPENSPREFQNVVTPAGVKVMGHPMPVTINAVIEVAICKELLESLLFYADRFRVPAERQNLWRRIVDGLPAYQVNADGAVKEWLHPAFTDHYRHRHLSHLYPVFPANEVMRENAPELFSAFEKAVDLRELGGQSGWSLTHMAAIYARFGRSEDAAGCLDTLAKGALLRNFFTLHNDWRNMGVTGTFGELDATLQLDALMGSVNAVQEMLFRVMPNEVRLLPALPERLSEGRVRGFAFFGGTASLAWGQGGKTLTAEFTFDRDTTLTIRLPEQIHGPLKISGASRVEQRDKILRVVAKRGDGLVFETEKS